ncbi:MAG: anaerobic ribonucleoside-triphosphate reductase activating protein [Treponema sp.]|nr:anaerobic ribonucleoside-triphosphate reductase activating protein [Treponema sp.]
MADLPLNEPAGVLVKTTCVDYPGLVAGSFFLRGCNLRCPYCYNVDLVTGKSTEGLNTVQELFDLMEKRQGILKGIVISGGEALLNPYTPIIIKKAKELNYKVKLDTNGTLPVKLQSLIDNEELKPDFIAMDLKTSPERYAKSLCPVFSKYVDNDQHWKKLVEDTAKLVATYPSDCREWRTVLVPGLVTKEDIEKMAEVLPADASWQFAQFMNKGCLDPAYNEIYPYTDQEAKELVEYAKTFIKGAELR